MKALPELPRGDEIAGIGPRQEWPVNCYIVLDASIAANLDVVLRAPERVRRLD